MKVYREEDPMDSGWTTISNDILWTDLSCRAVGLLVRWLSKPPGVEVDTIQDIVTRAKRRGNKRMEGRDALYTASYELEAEGYLVRRLVAGEKGQHEWVAFVRSRPVAVEERSNPADRKRDSALARKAPTAPSKPKPAPAQQHGQRPRKPDFQGSALTSNDAASSQVAPVTGFPDSGDPDSENQGSSYKDSLKSSLSLQQQADDTQASEARETAAPTDKPQAPPAAGIPKQRQEITEMVMSLPGRPVEADALDLEPLVLDALAASWTLPQLRKHLASKCDPSRVFDVCAIYRKHLKRLPAAAGTGAEATPKADCPDCNGSGLLEDPETFLPAGKCGCRLQPANA